MKLRESSVAKNNDEKYETNPKHLHGFIFPSKEHMQSSFNPVERHQMVERHDTIPDSRYDASLSREI